MNIYSGSLWFHPSLLNFVTDGIDYDKTYDDAIGIHLDYYNYYDGGKLYELLKFLISVELPIMYIQYDKTFDLTKVHHYRFKDRSVLNNDTVYTKLNDEEKKIVKFYEVMNAV